MTDHLAHSLKGWLTYRTRPVGDCLVWTGKSDTRGYARVHYLGTRYRVHRLVYMLVNGLDEMPDDLKVRKICGRWGCVKPEHFQRFVQRRWSSKVCKYGHPFSPANTYTYKKSSPDQLGRMCLACARARRKGIDPRLEPVRAAKRAHGTNGYCSRGHNLKLPLPHPDIYVLPNGERRCRICKRRSEREREMRNAANKKTPTVH
jgi:hypothetical protein